MAHSSTSFVPATTPTRLISSLLAVRTRSPYCSSCVPLYFFFRTTRVFVHPQTRIIIDKHVRRPNRVLPHRLPHHCPCMVPSCRFPLLVRSMAYRVRQHEIILPDKKKTRYLSLGFLQANHRILRLWSTSSHKIPRRRRGHLPFWWWAKRPPWPRERHYVLWWPNGRLCALRRDCLWYVPMAIPSPYRTNTLPQTTKCSWSGTSVRTLTYPPSHHRVPPPILTVAVLAHQARGHNRRHT
jgi:hypothetical protein